MFRKTSSRCGALVSPPWQRRHSTVTSIPLEAHRGKVWYYGSKNRFRNEWWVARSFACRNEWCCFYGVKERNIPKKKRASGREDISFKFLISVPNARLHRPKGGHLTCGKNLANSRPAVAWASYNWSFTTNSVRTRKLYSFIHRVFIALWGTNDSTTQKTWMSLDVSPRSFTEPDLLCIVSRLATTNHQFLKSS